MHRGSCFFRFLFVLLLIGGVVMAVNAAYRSGFALGYMTSQATGNGAADPAAAADALAASGFMPWGVRPHGGFPFGFLFFGFIVFVALGKMFSHGRYGRHGHAGGPGSWGPPGHGGWGSHRSTEPREKTPEDIL